MSLGDWASIATLALFAIYFAGRIITIFRMQPLESNEISVVASDDAYQKFNLVEDFYLCQEAPCAVVFKSITGIRSFTVYELEYDDELNVIGRKATEMSISFVNIGNAIGVFMFLPELVPEFEVEYKTMDYRKVTLRLVDNMKNGVISDGLVSKHTFKSVMYNLLK